MIADGAAWPSCPAVEQMFRRLLRCLHNGPAYVHAEGVWNFLLSQPGLMPGFHVVAVSMESLKGETQELLTSFLLLDQFFACEVEMLMSTVLAIGHTL